MNHKKRSQQRRLRHKAPLWLWYQNRVAKDRAESEHLAALYAAIPADDDIDAGAEADPDGSQFRAQLRERKAAEREAKMRAELDDEPMMFGVSE